MKKIIKLVKVLLQFGFNPAAFYFSLKGLPLYLRDYSILKKQKGNDNNFNFGILYPILGERFAPSGTMSGDYFHQDLYVARKIFVACPHKHLDIGSRTDGFVAHVASYREIDIIDIREQESKVKNITFRKADLMQLPPDIINAYDSISSLHAIEHFGLGRYGDPIDYYGHLKAIKNITKILQSGGTFYFSVPIGKQRIEFNAHRVFSIQYLIDIFQDNFIIKSFSYIDDNREFHEEVDLTEIEVATNFDCNYGCGIFELIKK